MSGRNDLEFTVLSEISCVIVQERNVTLLLKKVLKVLQQEMNLFRGSFALIRDGMLCTEASFGTPAGAESCRLGEGAAGRAALTGKAELLAGENASAILCVPVILRLEQIIGTLSVETLRTTEAELLRKMKLLENVAAITAEAVDSCCTEHREKEQLQEENLRLREELQTDPRPASIIGNSSAMRLVYTQIAQVAPSSATVLIRGASGTGKELVARAIQQAGPRAGKPFICVNCAALPDNLIESELFGHEKGSFTGAVTSRIGRAEAADGGTLFLDEIGDLSLPLQVKLLRFIQERTISRVGSNAEIKVDVRIITATGCDLEKQMEEGKFREDLYYRLNVFPILLPPLYTRRSDILLLAEHFLERFNTLYGKNIRRLSTPAINMLMSYHWPGNVRELENCMERAVLTAKDDVIHGYNLPPSLQTGEPEGTTLTASAGENADFETLVTSFERELIVAALKAENGNVAASARRLHLSQRILHYKIRKMGITPEWYKQRRETGKSSDFQKKM